MKAYTGFLDIVGMVAAAFLSVHMLTVATMLVAALYTVASSA